MYTKAASFFAESIDQIIERNSTEPWAKIEGEMKRAILADPDCIKTIAQMADGAVLSMGLITSSIESSRINDAEKSKKIRLAPMDLISVIILRSFVIGAHCQKSAMEVDDLERMVN